MSLDKGLIQVYTGDGKGKTTAAFGLGLRAAGRGLTVLIHQFFKLATEPSGEQLLGIKHITVRRGDFRHPFFDKHADRELIRAKILEALEGISAEMASGRFDVVVLDEVNNALRDKFVTWEEFGDFIASKPLNVELVCTGRGAPAELLERADYVTEFKKMKHPMEKGQAARIGIEM
jgi:cob(I)alamin adenosyltransferase